MAAIVGVMLFGGDLSAQQTRAARANAGTETASLPRADLAPERATDLPRPLSEADAKHYRNAFAAQARGAGPAHGSRARRDCRYRL